AGIVAHRPDVSLIAGHPPAPAPGCQGSGGGNRALHRGRSGSLADLPAPPSPPVFTPRTDRAPNTIVKTHTLARFALAPAIWPAIIRPSRTPHPTSCREAATMRDTLSLFDKLLGPGRRLQQAGQTPTAVVCFERLLALAGVPGLTAAEAHQ